MVKFILYFVFIFAIFHENIAQNVNTVTTEQATDALNKAKAKGLSDQQIEAAAASKGLSPAEILKLKEKAANNKKTTTTTVEVDSETNNEEKVEEKPEEKITPQEIVDPRLAIFGLNIFNKKEVNFQPNLRIPIPRNYILGTDDELSIDISGYAYTHYVAKVSPEGSIRIENLSPIFVSGQTIEQAKEKIVNRLKTLFAGLSTSGTLTCDVTLTKLRSIKVNVIGEAVHPGTYTVPSIATAFNLLYEAGGPTIIGTLRNIEVFRSGKIIKRMDLYDYLLKGDLSDNIVLQDQDVLHIPYVTQNVTLIGQLRNPKIFEIHTNDNLSKILEYAGGFTENAYINNIKIERNTDIGKKLIILEKANINNFILQKGDIITVESISDKSSNIVSISGGVIRPGIYSFEKAPSISKLIALAEGLSPDAFTKRFLIIRKNEKFESEILDFNFADFKNNNSVDFPLVALDEVIVSTWGEITEKRTIQISGEINKAQTLAYAENMTVSEALIMAGGLKESANASKIEIARRVVKDGISDDKTVEILNITIDPVLLSTDKDNKFVLKPFDVINVRKLAQYEGQKTVTITGEVNYPGTYTLLDKKDKITDLIERAGGLKNQSDLKNAQFIRNDTQVGVNFKNMGDEQNLFLLNGDKLLIPRIKQTVKISGNVYNPNTVPFENGLKYKDYLTLAGGGTDSSKVSKSYIKYSNGRINRVKSFLGFRTYPKVEAGSEIIVPTERIEKMTRGERISISTAIVSMSVVLVSFIRLFIK